MWMDRWKKRKKEEPAGKIHCLRRWFSVPVSLALAVLVLHTAAASAHRGLLQQGIAGEVLRFHVLAASDSEEDQQIKLLVRDRVMAWLSEECPGDAGREQTMDFLEEHLSEIEGEADRILEEQHVSYRSRASLERCYFPVRTYGSLTFPAGWYQALRICLGDAEGKNWWCILYPKLCFSDCLHGAAEEEELGKLEEALTVEEYESLLRSPGKWKISFRWF